MGGHGRLSPATLAPMLRLDVDRDSRTPPYRQVACQLADAIRRGEYAPGERLPSIIDLTQAAGIARYTARKALHVLEAEGLAELEPGMGFYVPDRLPPD